MHHTKATPLASRRARGVVLQAGMGVHGPADGYPAVMRSRVLRSWVIAVFILLGILVALALMVRDLGDGNDVPEDGTMPVSTR